MISKNFVVASASSAAVGSSIRMIFVCFMMAFAISTICISPVERDLTFCRGSMRMPISRKNSAAFRMQSRSEISAPRIGSVFRNIFSATVISPTRL